MFQPASIKRNARSPIRTDDFIEFKKQPLLQYQNLGRADLRSSERLPDETGLSSMAISPLLRGDDA